MGRAFGANLVTTSRSSRQTPFVGNSVDEWRAAAAEPFSGWSFAHMAIDEEKPPWSYPDLASEALRMGTSALDLDTGGGEMLAGFHDAWPATVVAAEAWRPNLAVAAKRLRPLGAAVIGATSESPGLPFRDGVFDVVLGRHALVEPGEVARVLAFGGRLVTQQVGPNNHFDLREEFGVDDPLEPGLGDWASAIEAAGVRVVESGEWAGMTVFADVRTMVQFLSAVPWTIPGFSVDAHLDVLRRLHERHASGDVLAFTARRWYAVAVRN